MTSSVSVGLVFYNETDQVLDLVDFFSKPIWADSIAEIILIANHAHRESLLAIRSACINFPLVKIIVQNESHLAKARQRIVDLAQSEWIYFTDPDCQPEIKNFHSLLMARKESIFAVAGPNRAPADVHPFYRALQLLADSWLGNFGSSQSKVWHRPQWLVHAPTCNLLIQRKRIRFSFDPELTTTGEDLDFNLRHCCHGSDRILFLPQAFVWHHHPKTFSAWARKVFKWGVAQPWVIARRWHWQQFHRLTPLFGILSALILFSILQEGRIWLVSLYLGLTLVNSVWVIAQGKSFRFLQSHLILTWLTHLAYATGQVVGSWQLGKHLLSARLRKIDSPQSQLNNG